MPSSILHLSNRSIYLLSICVTLLVFVSLRASRQDASPPASGEGPNYFTPTGERTGSPDRVNAVTVGGAPNLPKPSISEQSITTDTDRYGKLPLSFEINEGQTDAQVKFLSRGPGYDLFLTPTEAVFNLRKPQVHHPDKFEPAFLREGVSSVTEQRSSVFRLKTIDANEKSRVDGENELPGKINYLIGNDPGNWHVNIPT